MITIALLIVIAYLFYAVGVCEETPESISQTYYLFGSKGWLVQVVLIAVGLLLLIPWMEQSPQQWQFLVFLACGSLLFVGVAPQFRLELEGAVHYGGASICCMSVLTWQIAVGEYAHLSILALYAAVSTFIKPKSYMWFIEWAVIFSLFFALL